MSSHLWVVVRRCKRSGNACHLQEVASLPAPLHLVPNLARLNRGRPVPGTHPPMNSA